MKTQSETSNWFLVCANPKQSVGGSVGQSSCRYRAAESIASPKQWRRNPVVKKRCREMAFN